MTDLNTTVETISAFVSGKSYITGIEECTKTENGITKTGYKISYVTYNNGVASSETSVEIYNGVDGTNGTNGHTPVVGLRAGDPSNGESTSDWYWTIDGSDLLVNGSPVKANGANGTNGTNGTDAPVPSFEINDNGELVVTVGENVTNLGKIVGTDGTDGTNSSITVVKDETTGKITINFVVGTDVTDSIDVPVYIANPIITFYKDESRSGTPETAITDISGSGIVIYFKIVGNFTSKPAQVFAACEGNWTSSGLSWDLVDENNNKHVEGTVTVKPTTAYVGDDTEGKLTLYVPYYGVTGIGQVTLSSKGAGDVQLQSIQRPMQVLTKSATDNSASVTFSLEGEDAYSSSGRVLIDNNYTLKNLNERENGTLYEEGCGFSSQLSSDGGDGWITTDGSLAKNGDGSYTQNFKLEENNGEGASPRTGAVVVFSPSGREVTRFVIRQNAKDEETINATPLVEGKSANCYIITSSGTYELDAYKGAFNDLSDGTKCTGKPRIVWNDGQNDIDFLYETFADNKIVFNVPNAVKPGNAVIAIVDDMNTESEADDEIQWSWHLWFCTSSPLVDVNEPSGTPMDRNLGAITSATEGLELLNNVLPLYWKDGLYYQWGRKDPLNVNITSGTNAYASLDGGSLDEATKHPNTFYKGWSSNDGWDNSKNEFDPCPPGYKVPSIDVWSKTKEDFNRYINSNQYIFVYDLTDYVLFPYSGFLDQAGIKQEGISGLGKLKEGTYNMPGLMDLKDYPKYPEEQEGLSTKPNDNPRRYDSASYTIVDDKKVGELWTVEKSLEFGYEDKGVKITAHKYQEGYWESYRTISISGFVTRYRAKYSGDNWIPVESEVSENGEFKDKLPTNVREKFNGYIKADYNISNLGSAIAGFIQNLGNLGSWFNSGIVYEQNNINKQYGYNVRCVKE